MGEKTMTNKQPPEQRAVGKEERHFGQRIEVVPSILSADFTNLGNPLGDRSKCGAVNSELHRLAETFTGEFQQHTFIFTLSHLILSKV